MPDPAVDLWPDAIDRLAILGVVILAAGLPLAGYVFMVLDFRAYLQSLRRTLVVVKGYATSLPEWVVRDTPPCLAALGLRPPCSREDVLKAYREKVKDAHPDRGGDRQAFARLQKHFEQAMALVAMAEESAVSPQANRDA